MGVPGAGRIERATAADLGQLAADAGSVPNQVGAVLVLDVPAGADIEAVRTVIADRLARVPRLRQRLMATPVGYGPPVWIDDPRFDVDRHLQVRAWPAPGDEAALLHLAAAQVTAPLDPTWPRWSVTLVVGAERDDLALILVFHHVMADGIGGLAVLAQLVDVLEEPPPTAISRPPPVPRPPPTARQLRLDAAARRRAALRNLSGAPARLRAALRELGGQPGVAVRCSLNRPTGPRRRVTIARSDLTAVRAVARAHGATVNDVVLAAVSRALGDLLDRRGEDVERLVVSMPVAATRALSGGNQAGVAVVSLPTRGTPAERLPEIAAVTRARKREQRGASAPLLGLGLRSLARLRLLRWFIDHQRTVHTFVTNLRGPDRPVAIVGMPVTDLIPLSLTTGNVTVAFAAMSYAGTLTVTVVTDPAHHPDHGHLAQAVEDELPGTGREPHR